MDVRIVSIIRITFDFKLEIMIKMMMKIWLCMNKLFNFLMLIDKSLKLLFFFMNL
jgi:hypothetical protein